MAIYVYVQTLIYGILENKTIIELHILKRVKKQTQRPEGDGLNFKAVCEYI